MSTASNVPPKQGFAEKTHRDLRSVRRDLKALYTETAALSKLELTAKTFKGKQIVCSDLMVRYEGLAAARTENLSLSMNSDDDVVDVEDGLATVLMLCRGFKPG